MPFTKPPPRDPACRRRWLSLLALLLVAAGAYGGYRALRPDPNLRKVRELQKELFSPAAKALPAEQRSDRFRQLREATGKLSSEQRQELAREGEKRFEGELDRYLALSPQEKRQYLDERINRMEQARQKMQQQRKGTPGASPGRPGGGQTFVAGQAPGGAGRNRTPPTAEEREKRRKQRLDNSTPEFRAKRDQFAKEMAERRRQRGLTATPAFGR